jgi:hypothetical protein
MVLTLLDGINNLEKNKESKICCFGTNSIYGVEVSYINNKHKLQDDDLRIIADSTFGEEVASDYDTNSYERSIHFQFKNLINFKKFIRTVLDNKYKIQFICENNDVIWTSFKEV